MELVLGGVGEDCLDGEDKLECRERKCPAQLYLPGLWSKPLLEVPTMDILARVRARVKVDEVSGCWNWSLTKDKDGYGKIKISGKHWRVHRAVYFTLNPDADKRLHVLHRCDNTCCCNPEHIYLGTNCDNVRDKVARGRQSRPIGELHPGAKLTEDRVRDVRAILNQGLTQAEIGRQFGISQASVSLIKNRINWKHTE